MSKYTTELRYICETKAGLVESAGYNSIDTVIDNCREDIFDFTYPIFDEAYRPVIERKILKHYYTREICAETVGLWKHFLDMRMNEIMPYYNKLYESELLEFNPFNDVNLTTDYTKDGSNSSEGEMHNTGTIQDAGSNSNTRTDNLSRSVTGSDIEKNTRWDIYSDTPQGALTNVQNEHYLTNARKIVDDGTGTTREEVATNTGTQTNSGTNSNTRTLNTANTTTDEITTTESYLHHIIGKTGGVSYSKLLQEYRQTFMNIDMQIIGALSDLFFGLW